MMRTPEPRFTGSMQSGPSSGLVALADATSVELPFAPGDLIAGKYEVLKLIGSGGMGYVVAATHVELGEVVALKFLRPEALQIEELVERFAREARAAAKIRSEHVARVFDVGTLPDGVPFIVMEHLAGQDLAEVLAQGGPLPIKVAVEYVMQACEALAAAHAAGVIHRDIKPENLFLTRHAQGLDFIKILDFGISKVALTPGGKRAFVRTMMPIGSPVYMSPEQIRSSENVDARTDIWSLGCVLFELLTGVVAFDEPTLMQLSAAILEQDPAPLRALLPDAPVELEDVLMRCLEKDASKRYGNIAELAIALYPFAPRRSRISAERCYHALKNAGIDCPDFDVQSVFPPSLGDLPAPSSGGPRRLTSTTPTMPGTPTMPARSATPVAPASAVKSVIIQPEPRVSAPSVLTVEEVASLQPPRTRKIAAFVGLVALGAAAYLAVVRTHQSELLGAAKEVAPITGAAEPPSAGFSGALAKTQAKAGSVASPIDLDALPADPGAAKVFGNALPPARAARPTVLAVPQRRGPSAPPKATTVTRKHSGDDELDVGY